MHEAYIVYNQANILVPIESIISHDNKVIIGTRPGHLLVYTFSPVLETRQPGLSLVHYNKAFSDKPIRQIDLIPEYHMLFSLSNDVISVHDMNRTTFPLVSRCAETKGASLFSLDVERSRSLTGETTLVVRICVAVKRKLQLWYWKNEKFMRLYDDIDMSDVPKSVLLSGNTICLGFKSEYLLYNIAGDKAEKIDLFPTGAARDIDPCITLINDHFAVAKDDYLIAVYPDALKKEQVPLAGSSGKAPEIVHDQVLDNTNTFKSLVWSQNIKGLVWDEPYAVALTKNALEVRVLKASETDKDTLIQTIPDLQNARFLLRSKSNVLLAASTTTLWYIEAVDITIQRDFLLNQKKFHLCLQLTNISHESDEEKFKRSNRIQTIYAYDLFANKLFKESMAEFIKLKVSPIEVIRLFPNIITSGTTPVATPPSEIPISLPVLESRDLENGLLALIDYLVLVRYNLKQQLDGKSPADAKQFSDNPTELLSIIDTSLLKCYLQTNDSMVPSLIRRNYCHFEESEKTLKQYRKLDELKILYQYKGYHRKALQLLQAEANKPGSSLAGHEWTINYLQQLDNDHKRVVFEFAGWVLDKHPVDGLKIFTEDLVESNRLARAEVLDYLLKNHSALVIPYLEHIIHVWGESKTMFHNILVQQYLEKIKEFKSQTTDSPTKTKSELAATRSTLKEFLLKSAHYAQGQVLQNFPSDGLFEERAIVLGKLGMHEKVIAIYLQINGDVQGAADYCEEVYNADPSNDSIYVSLVRALLTVPTTPPYSGVTLHPNCLQPQTDFVLALLEKHATRMNAHAVLQILPGSIPLKKLENFLEKALRAQLARRRKDQVLKGLLNAEKLQLQDELMMLRAKSVTLTEQSVCPVCTKRFTNQGAFVRYPDGKIVHYSCQENP